MYRLTIIMFRPVLFIVLVSFLICASCSNQDITELIDYESKNLIDRLDPITRAEFHSSFMEDFVVNGLGDNRSTIAINYLTKMHLLGGYDDRELYLEVKKEFERSLDTDEKGIQDMALRYLRWSFLEDETEFAFKETKYLLAILVEQKAIDLDIISDAYIKVEESLNSEERTLYASYIRHVANADIEYANAEFSALKEKYESEEDDKVKVGILLYGKHLSRKSQAALYSLERIATVHH